MMTKYSVGSMAESSSTYISMSLLVPEYMCGKSTALSFASFSSPKVVYAMVQSLRVSPSASSNESIEKYSTGPWTSSV